MTRLTTRTRRKSPLGRAALAKPAEPTTTADDQPTSTDAPASTADTAAPVPVVVVPGLPATPTPAAVRAPVPSVVPAPAALPVVPVPAVTPPAAAPVVEAGPPLGDLRGVFGAATDAAGLRAAYEAMARRHREHRRGYLGFPVAFDLDFPLSRELLAGGFFNNISTTKHWPPGFQHAMEAEERVLDWFSDLIGLPADNRWGHLTTGGTAGNRSGIRIARNMYPNAVFLHASDAHYSVARAGQDLRLPTYQVRSTPRGSLDLADLDATLGVILRGRPMGSVPVIVLATYGSTMTEATDDIDGIHAALDAHGVTTRYVHLDAALAGIPLALDKAADFFRVDSVSVSGYKFLAVPDACGIVVGRGTPSGEHIAYTDTLDATETGVRSGRHAAMLLESIVTVGDEGHRQRAHASRELADYAIGRLRESGWNAWRNPNAYFTIVFPTPGPSIREKWTISNHSSGISHALTIPGHTREVYDEFLDDMAAARPPRSNTFAGLAAQPR